jgi:hypothetical protein
MDNEVIAVVEAAPVRRAIGVGMLYLLGGLLLYLGLVQPTAGLGWQVFLIATAAGSLAMGEAMRRATALRIEMTREGLRDSAGRVLARTEDIRALDRGVFAFKPSNGFLLTTKSRQGRVWAPGLWWRIGRRIGVGGVTPAGQTKFMAEMIAVVLQERDG